MIKYIEHNNLQKIQTVLTDTNYKIPESEDKDEHLLLACEKGNLEPVRLLLEYGYDSDLMNYDEETPLHISLMKGNYELTLLIFKYNPDPNVRDEDDNTPLHLAATSGAVDICTKLIELGAEIDPIN